MQPSLRVSDLNRFRVAYPPLPEQQAFADFLDRKTAQIDTLIAKKQRLIELLGEETPSPHQPRRHQGPRSQRADEGLGHRVVGGDTGTLEIM